MFWLDSRVVPLGLIIPSMGKRKPYDLSHHRVEEGSSKNESMLAKEKGADVLYKDK